MRRIAEAHITACRGLVTVSAGGVDERQAGQIETATAVRMPNGVKWQQHGPFRRTRHSRGQTADVGFDQAESPGVTQSEGSLS